MHDQGTAPRERKETRTISIAPSLSARVEAFASKAGHGTFSTVVVAAITEYLDRRESTEEAA